MLVYRECINWQRSTVHCRFGKPVLPFEIWTAIDREVVARMPHRMITRACNTSETPNRMFTIVRNVDVATNKSLCQKLYCPQVLKVVRGPMAPFSTQRQWDHQWYHSMISLMVSLQISTFEQQYLYEYSKPSQADLDLVSLTYKWAIYHKKLHIPLRMSANETLEWSHSLRDQNEWDHSSVTFAPILGTTFCLIVAFAHWVGKGFRFEEMKVLEHFPIANVQVENSIFLMVSLNSTPMRPSMISLMRFNDIIDGQIHKYLGTCRTSPTRKVFTSRHFR